jgi:hypothetical protein
MGETTPDKSGEKTPLTDAELDRVPGGVNRTIAPPKPPAAPTPAPGGELG